MACDYYSNLFNFIVFRIVVDIVGIQYSSLVFKPPVYDPWEVLKKYITALELI